MKTVIISAGGTGGHIIPAIAVANEFKNRGINVIFVGNRDSMEKEIAKKNGIPFFVIDVQKIYRKFTFKHLKFPFKLIFSILKSKKIIRKFKPDAFLGTGSFVSGPVGIASLFAKIPIFVQEQNSFPGLTNRKLGKFCKKIFLGNDQAKSYFPPNRTILSGNPTLIKNKKDKIPPEIYEKYGLDSNKKTLLILGGSQGALAVNEIISENVKYFLDLGYNLIWQTGKNHLSNFKSRNDQFGTHIFSFTDNLSILYEMADIAIARGGALTLAELEIMKIPSIIIPYPYAAGNHQYYNSLHLLKENKIEILKQDKLNTNSLKKCFKKMSENYSFYKENFENNIHESAAKKIVDEMISKVEVSS